MINGNIVLNQIIVDNSIFSFKEFIPIRESNDELQTLVINKDLSIYWTSFDLSTNIIVDNRFKDTSIFYDNGRLGVGRFPLYNYKVDIAVPQNTLMTALHIGDGSFGFSMGNGTNTGFIPEIIGIGKGENDAGLYFVGVAGNNEESNVPLILIDGRNTFGRKLTNRPVFGVTSADYSNYMILVDASGKMNVKEDIIINNESLLKMIRDLQAQIKELRDKIK